MRAAASETLEAHRYVERPTQEAEVRHALDNGVLALVGPRGAGKTWLLEHVLSEDPQRLPSRRVVVDFDEFPGADPIEVLGNRLTRMAGLPPVSANAHELGFLVPTLLEEPLLLHLEHLEAPSRHWNFSRFMVFLSQWITSRAISPRWEPLYLILTARAPVDTYFISRASVQVQDMSSEELLGLATRADPRFSRYDVSRTLDAIGGNAHLSRSAFAVGKDVLPEVLANPLLLEEVSRATRDAADWAHRLPESALLQLRKALAGSPTPWNTSHPLFIEGYALGVLDMPGNIRYPFYRSALRPFQR